MVASQELWVKKCHGLHFVWNKGIVVNYETHVNQIEDSDSDIILAVQSMHCVRNLFKIMSYMFFQGFSKKKVKFQFGNILVTGHKHNLCGKWKKVIHYFIIDSREKVSLDRKSLQIQAKSWDFFLNPVFWLFIQENSTCSRSVNAMYGVFVISALKSWNFTLPQ